MIGFEPTTSCSQSKRATRLRYTLLFKIGGVSLFNKKGNLTFNLLKGLSLVSKRNISFLCKKRKYDYNAFGLFFFDQFGLYIPFLE